MKKNFTLLVSLLLITFGLSAQNGYIIEYLGGGPLYSIDLSNAQKTFVGNTMNNYGAGDIGADGMLYAINSGTNMLYKIDVTDGSSTLIGSIPPPEDHVWTGMAYDETNNIMYGYSGLATSSGEGSLHIIDITNGSYTLVGTQTTAVAIGCIGITDDGQMYGMNLIGGAKIYEIDTDNGAVSLVGPIGQLGAGMGHGMDYCSANQTMYITTYNSDTFANTLRTVNLTNGSTTQVGDILGGWMGVIAIPSPISLTANFSADVTEICTEEEVHFTDQSVSATSWLWTFEGGTPATSTDQNPTVTYSTAGTFDVTLEVSDGTETDTKLIEDMITVSPIPTPEVAGETDVCVNNELTYTTADNSGSTYNWNVVGGDIVNGNGTSEISVVWTIEGEGSVQVTETSAESCEGSSEILIVTVNACLSADFSADITDICDGNTVQYTDQSVAATSWLWTFEGGTPATSTEQNPNVTYHTAGIYDVTLEVSNGSDTETAFEEDMITVHNCTGLNESSLDGITLFPNPAKDYISIAFASAENIYEVSIYNQLGHRVFVDQTFSVEEQSLYRIDLTSFANGLYIVKMTNSSNQVYKLKFEILK